jgi:hypothetical protein
MNNLHFFRPIFLFIVIPSFLLCSSCKKDEEKDDITPVPDPASLFSDDFKSTSLKDGWYWANEPSEWDINTSRIDYLFFIGNLDANIWCEDNTSRLYQIISSEQDFDVYTHMRYIWGNNASDVAGIVCKSATSGDWVILKFWMHGDLSGRLEFQTKCNDLISPVPGSLVYGGDIEFYLRMKKEGNDYSAYFKFNEGDDWTLVGTTQFEDQLPLQLGIFGGTDSGNGELIVEVDYFTVD